MRFGATALTSELAMGGETRARAITKIKAAYTSTHSLLLAAKKLDVSERTLQRWIIEIPELKDTIQKLRAAKLRKTK